MAVFQPVLTFPGGYKATDDGSLYLVTWGPFTQADTCAPVTLPQHSDRSCQAVGTFGGASVAIQGSNDGVNYAPLDSPNSVVIALTTATQIKAVLENSLWIQPVATGGAGQSISVLILFRMTNPMRT
jgi:hypothetical protein